MEHNINYIIARVLSGACTSDDVLALCEWLNEKEKNRDEFRLLKSYWDAEVTYNQSNPPALAAEKLQQRIERQKTHGRKTEKWEKFSPLIAAVILLFVFSIAFFMVYSHNQASEYYTLLTEQQKSDFTMPDGTVITLNKNSRLRYSDQYGKRKRKVKLEGEAFFDVVKNVSQPFEVEMNGGSIAVMGTRFNVKADIDTEEIKATLEKGSIRFNGAQQNIILTPGQQLTFNKSTRKIEIKHVDTDIFTLWKDNLIKYKSIPFVELISELKKEYDVNIQIDNCELINPSMTVSGTFSKEQNIEQVLKVIARSLPIKWYNSNGIYYIQYIKQKK